MSALENTLAAVVSLSFAFWLIVDALKADDRARRAESNRDRRGDRTISAPDQP
jgi:hypothetical protein